MCAYFIIERSSVNEAWPAQQAINCRTSIAQLALCSHTRSGLEHYIACVPRAWSPFSGRVASWVICCCQHTRCLSLSLLPRSLSVSVQGRVTKVLNMKPIEVQW